MAYELKAKKASDMKDGVLYRVADLQAILKNAGCNYSIYSIRDAESYKCTNYKCGKRYDEEYITCSECGSQLREPMIKSPRTVGGGRGVGHRRYRKDEILDIIEAFQKRV